MNQTIPPVYQVYHGDATIHRRIQQLIKESKDPDFTQCLNQLGNALWNGQISDETARRELDKNYHIYQQKMQVRMQQEMAALQVHMMPAENQKQEYIYPWQMRYISKTVAQPKKNMEFAVGAGVLGFTGAIFLLIAFVIFAMNND